MFCYLILLLLYYSDSPSGEAKHLKTRICLKKKTYFALGMFTSVTHLSGGSIFSAALSWSKRETVIFYNSGNMPPYFSSTSLPT